MAWTRTHGGAGPIGDQMLRYGQELIVRSTVHPGGLAAVGEEIDMPEYLAPGVYVEETSFRAKSIEGVSTTTTGFIGPTRYGPLDLEPEIITSLVEFERTYGDGERLQFVNTTARRQMDNYMWHAARAFFEEGGKRLYVSRVLHRGAAPATAARSRYSAGDEDRRLAGHLDRPRAVPGRAPADARVTFTFNIGQNVLVDLDGQTTAAGVQAGRRSLVDRRRRAHPRPRQRRSTPTWLLRRAARPATQHSRSLSRRRRNA